MSKLDALASLFSTMDTLSTPLGAQDLSPPLLYYLYVGFKDLTKVQKFRADEASISAMYVSILIYLVTHEYIDTPLRIRCVFLNGLMRLPFGWALGCLFSSQLLRCSHQSVLELSLGKCTWVVICLRDILFEYEYEYIHESFNGVKHTSNHSAFTVVTVRI